MIVSFKIYIDFLTQIIVICRHCYIYFYGFPIEASNFNAGDRIGRKENDKLIAIAMGN